MVQTVRCKVDLIKYRNALNEIEAPFKGLPYVNIVLIKQLIGIADLQTGIVGNTTYCRLASCLIINPAPGRKESGTPTKQTIRNYIKSIERECGDYFKVISEGQELKFLFPQLPKIFSACFKDIEDNAEVNTDLTQSNIAQFLEKPKEKVVLAGEVNIQVNTDLNTEANTPDFTVKNINNKINNNNNNRETQVSFSNSQKTKKTIAPDFHPSAEILSRAFAAGYDFAADEKVIQEFIDKNQSWGSQFADFNPVYFNYLSQYEKYQQKKTKAVNTQFTRSNHEQRHSPKNNSHESLMERVRKANSHALAPSEIQELFPAPKVISIDGNEAEQPAHCLALG